jgi:hypothetical protein
MMSGFCCHLGLGLSEKYYLRLVILMIVISTQLQLHLHPNL